MIGKGKRKLNDDSISPNGQARSDFGTKVGQ